MAPVVHTVDDAAAIMRCSNDSVYRLIASGQLRAFNVGKRGKRITASALDEYMNGAATRPAADIDRAPPRHLNAV